tara:strand:- start:1399 stop:1698 length:300 start_codon:yes stop_codon:yes gene_type:complete
MKMKTTSSNVARMWASSRAVTNHSGAFRTDGRWLWSYDLVIGETTDRGIKVLYDYTARTDNFMSMTTSKHVGYARAAADWTVSPDEINFMELGLRLRSR